VLIFSVNARAGKRDSFRTLYISFVSISRYSSLMSLSPQHFDKNLFLVGPMGVGKTTIGRLLAKELGLEFIDSDQEIEKRAGTNIAWIFDVEGEEQFRVRESAVIDDLTQRSNVLIATGGGSVLRPENRKNLVSRGVVIFLDTSLELQIKRTEKDKKRPLLQKDNPKSVLKDLKAKRHSLYEEVMDVYVFVGHESSRFIINLIINQLKQASLLKK